MGEGVHVQSGACCAELVCLHHWSRAGLAEGLHVQARDLLALHTVYIYSACELGGAVGFAC